MDRRTLLMAGMGLGLLSGPGLTRAAPSPAMRIIPSSGERIPALGMGSWLTFDVGRLSRERDVRVQVLEAFFAQGGGLIDSSPMYGTSERVIGYCLGRLERSGGLFSATKVWTPGQWLGVQQMQHSMSLWGLERFDLMQVHNLVDWDTHLETLRAWKQEGRVRYVGITTSHGRRHEELAAILRNHPIDFVQLTYNIADREAERELLPLAEERGIAVIANRPFRRKRLFDPVWGRAVPGWARDIDCQNWAQIFLKFVISHPAVTCAIPATSRVDHMIENMGALRGRMPDPAERRQMATHYASL